MGFLLASQYLLINSFQVDDQNNVQHQPPGEPEAVHQQSASPGGLYDQCKRHGNSFPDLRLFLQNQGN